MYSYFSGCGRRPLIYHDAVTQTSNLVHDFGKNIEITCKDSQLVQRMTGKERLVSLPIFLMVRPAVSDKSEEKKRN